jgi:hypothetical protein
VQQHRRLARQPEHEVVCVTGDARGGLLFAARVNRFLAF